MRVGGPRPCGTDVLYRCRRWPLRETVRHVLGVLMLASRMHLVRGGRASSCCSPCLPTESPPSLCFFFLLLPFLYSSTAFNSLSECEPSASQIAFPFRETRSCYLQAAWWVCNLSYVLWGGGQKLVCVLCIATSYDSGIVL